jgi:ketosteroid isomerase-like protein
VNETEGFTFAAGNPYVGPDAVSNGVLMPLLNHIEGFSVQPVHILNAGNTVVVEGRSTAPSRRRESRSTRIVHIWGIEQNTIVRFQQYADTMEWKAVTRGPA